MGPLLTLLLLVPGPVRWTFDSEAPGRIPAGWEAAVGRWEIVTEEGSNRVIAQQAVNANPVFNVLLVDRPQLRDVDLSVRLKPVSGKLDQGGGLVWRAKDARNYYVARYNPLEQNLRLYKVEDGRRTQLQSAESVPSLQGWCTLRVTMRGERIECWLEGKKLLNGRDATFAEAGRVGLWSKADAQTWFDDFTAAEP